jgi:hypothetical protein
MNEEEIRKPKKKLKREAHYSANANADDGHKQCQNQYT